MLKFFNKIQFDEFMDPPERKVSAAARLLQSSGMASSSKSNIPSSSSFYAYDKDNILAKILGSIWMEWTGSDSELAFKTSIRNGPS